MKTEAEALQKRAVAGEEFDKLQQEAFDFAGMKAKAPTTKMAKVRRNTSSACSELSPKSVAAGTPGTGRPSPDESSFSEDALATGRGNDPVRCTHLR